MVDDNPRLLRTVAHLLAAEDWECRTARAGIEALCLIAARKPDILFVDQSCPELDGFQLCALLKSRAEYAELPVVLLSDGKDLFDQVKGRALGARAMLHKPFSRRELLACLPAAQPHAV